jgi:hypothetical protein
MGFAYSIPLGFLEVGAPTMYPIPPKCTVGTHFRPVI